MHHIQRKILSLLVHSPALNYARLRPQGVESNHFAYHLEQLTKAGIITKRDGLYALTLEGAALADRLSHASISVRKQPQIVTSICISNETGETALFRHGFQPYLGLLGLPQGRLHYEEHVQEAAQRELQEKTSLHDIALRHRGIVYITATKDGAVVSKILAHVFTGKIKGYPPLASVGDSKGEALWSGQAGQDESYMPGYHEIRGLLEASNTFFFAEIEAAL